MNLFIGCSAMNNIDEKYKKETEEVVSKIAQINNINLIMGAVNDNCGLLDICYKYFKEYNQKITGISLTKYKDLPKLEMDEIFEVETSMDRIKLIYQKSNIILFLPGGIGTYSELFSVLAELLEKKEKKIVIIYNQNFFFTPIIKELYNLYQQGFIEQNVYEYCHIESKVEDVLKIIKEEL